MDRPHFQIQIAGREVAPETIDITELAPLLIDLRRAMCLTAGMSTSEQPDAGPVISLVGVKSGSCSLQLAASPASFLGAAAIAEAIADDEYSKIPFEAQMLLCGISKKVVKRDWTLSFAPGPGGKLKPATISREHEVPDPAARTISGTTTIYGRCMRVGGEEPGARIKLTQNQKTLSIDVSEELAKQLAPRLYADVGLEGAAVWRLVDFELVQFRAKRILGYKPAGAEQAFEELAEAAAGRWNGVNAEDFVRTLRAEDDE